MQGWADLRVGVNAARSRRDLGDDDVAVEVGAIGSRSLCHARVLPCPPAGVPVVGTPRAGRINHRQPSVARRVQQFLDCADPVPGLSAARIAPVLDRFEDRRGFISAEKVVDVDDEQRGTLAEALARAITRDLEDLFILLGKKFVPDRFGHRGSF